MRTTFQVAIDGPVAAGKGTISRKLAEKLGYLYVDTGAMYRAAAYIALSNNCAPDDAAQLVPLLEKAKIELHVPAKGEEDGRLVTVLIDGKDVSWDIRTSEISAAVPKTASQPEVRTILVAKQQEIAQKQNVVMEGRDITYRVLPDADLKIYLTASELIRTRRRYHQLTDQGETVAYETVKKNLLERDEMDMQRSTDPLQIVDDAWVLDTSDFSIEAIVEAVYNRVRAMQPIPTE